MSRCFLCVVLFCILVASFDVGNPINQMIVKLHPGTDLHTFAFQHGVTYNRSFSFNKNLAIFDLPNLLHEPKFHLSPHVVFFEAVTLIKVERKVIWTDPRFAEQFHLDDSSTSPSNDLNVQPVWNAGKFGSGVNVLVIDDGVDISNGDISPNYEASFSYNFLQSTNDPTPESGESHGTACAGLVAAVGNNGICGVGVAPSVTVGGVNLIGGDSSGSSNANIATALTMGLEDVKNVDIYSNSWGPPDNADLYEIDEVIFEALYAGTQLGRGGKGAIYVWSGGNGAEDQDNSNYDNFANSIYTIAVGAIGKDGLATYYGEPGANLIVVAPTADDEDSVVTTANGANGCTSSFGGTSAACPMVSGGIALMLEENPELNWRDVQAILIATAVQNAPNDSDWKTNGAGHLVNHKFGFGRIDVDAAVTLASSWTSLTEQIYLELEGDEEEIEFFGGETVTINFNCPYDIAMEFVDIYVYLNADNRGELRITLNNGASPPLESVIYDVNDNENSTDGIFFKFMSARYWGESTLGDWSVDVFNGGTGEGIVYAIYLDFHGHCSSCGWICDGTCPSGESCIDGEGTFSCCDDSCEICSSDSPSCDTCPDDNNSELWDDSLCRVLFNKPTADVTWSLYYYTCISWDASVMGEGEKGEFKLQTGDNFETEITIFSDIDLSLGEFTWTVYGVIPSENSRIEAVFGNRTPKYSEVFTLTLPDGGFNNPCIAIV